LRILFTNSSAFAGGNDRMSFRNSCIPDLAEEAASAITALLDQSPPR
jgi:hypothetical protein